LVIAAILIASGILAPSYLGAGTTATRTETSTLTQSVSQSATQPTSGSATLSTTQSSSTTSTSASTQTSCQSVSGNGSLSCGKAPPDVKIIVGTPELNQGGESYDGSSSIFVESEVFPLTLTSPTDVGVNLTAQDVPQNVWVHFIPSELTVSPNGTLARMTISGGVQFAGPSINETMMVGATYGDASTLIPFTFVRTFNISVVQSASYPVEFPTPLTTSSDSITVSPYAAVYDPSASSDAPSVTAGISVLGLLAKNGTVMSMPSWLQVSFSNSSLLLTSNEPGFFMVAANTTTSAPYGTYQIAIAETLAGGHQAIVPLTVIIGPLLGSTMGGSMGMSSGNMMPMKAPDSVREDVKDELTTQAGFVAAATS
jgi:hypothetical protein